MRLSKIVKVMRIVRESGIRGAEDYKIHVSKTMKYHKRS